MKKISPLTVALLAIALFAACVPPEKDDDNGTVGQTPSPYPLAGTAWQGSYVEDNEGDGDTVYHDSTYMCMTMDTTMGNLRMMDYYYVNGALDDVDTDEVPFSYLFADKNGTLTIDYGDGETDSYTFSVEGDVFTCPPITLYRVK